jgi:hypothetical protein
MQCPDCGYEADDTAIFCPQCRFQFREAADSLQESDTGTQEDTIPPADTGMAPPQPDESLFDEDPGTFSKKEQKQLQVQLLQPAFLLVLIVSLLTYTVISGIPFVPVTFAGLDFGVSGLICLAAGVLAGTVFFFLVCRSLTRFRS